MPLTHDDVLLLHAYLDGELDLATSLNMERRIREDPVLQRVAREVKGLKLALSRMHTDRRRRRRRRWRLCASPECGRAPFPSRCR